MATKEPQPNSGPARPSNPFIHIPFQAQDLAGVEVTGGGATELTPITPEFRNQLAATLDTTWQSLQQGFEQYPDIPAVVVLALRDDGIAKTHRPLELAIEAGMPSAGHGEMNEMLVAANHLSLPNLKSIVLTRDTKKIRANLSAVASIRPWDSVRRLPAALRAMPVQSRDASLRESGRILVRLFRHRDDHINLRVEERLQSLLAQLDAVWTRLEQRVGPPLFLVEADETLSHDAIESLVAFPGIRSVMAEPTMAVTPASGEPVEIPIGTCQLQAGPTADAPTVAVFDTGVHPSATLLTPWVSSSETFVTNIDTDYVHGTQVASLIADARGLNGNHEWLSPTPCNVHDVCGLESTNGYISDLIQRLREAVSKRPDIHIWNLSLGLRTGIEVEVFSEFAKELDVLSDQHGVLFVVAAGNYLDEPRRGWPAHAALADRISSPSDSVRALTVGAIAHLANENSFVAVGEPAGYSRRGPGPVYTPKPDLVHIGGGMDNPWTSSETGMTVLCPANVVSRGSGTSFAAPVASAMAAHVWAALDGDDHDHGLEVSPTLVKALMIHSAELASPDRGSFERRYYGAGMPTDPLGVLYDSDDSFTLVFEADLAGGTKWRKSPYPIPAPLLVDGKLRAEVIITAVYAPPLDPNAGAEYVRANVELGFGVLIPDAAGKIQFKGRVPMEGEPGTTGYEKAQIEHGGKWSPVKVLRRTFKNGVQGTDWALQASVLRRALEPAMAEPLRVIVIVTLRSINGQQDIHQEGLNALATKNWISQPLPLQVPIQVGA